jgi:hypothetical protein
LVAKFTQHKALRKLLLGTGNTRLVEHTHNDRYWADGGDGTGRNRLGVLLMEVRGQLAADAADELQPSAEARAAAIAAAEAEAHSHRRRYGGRLPPAREATKRKGRRRREVFLEKDGSSKLEKTTGLSGQVTVVGTDTQIPAQALPTAAKIVVHRNQYRRRYEKTDDDDDEDDDDEEDEEEDDDDGDAGKEEEKANAAAAEEKQKADNSKRRGGSSSNEKNTAAPARGGTQLGDFLDVASAKPQSPRSLLEAAKKAAASLRQGGGGSAAVTKALQLRQQLSERAARITDSDDPALLGRLLASVDDLNDALTPHTKTK